MNAEPDRDEILDGEIVTRPTPEVMAAAERDAIAAMQVTE